MNLKSFSSIQTYLYGNTVISLLVNFASLIMSVIFCDISLALLKASYQSDDFFNGV